MRLLDLELAHKREQWKRTHQRARSARINALAFLFLLIVGAAMACMFLFSSVGDERAHSRTPTATSAPP